MLMPKRVKFRRVQRGRLKGKATRGMIEKLYGEGFFFEDAINACIPEAFDAAVKEAGLEVVGAPKFDLVSNDGDIVLKAEGFVKPEVSIEGYKGIEVERKVEEVTDETVEAEITRVRERNARGLDDIQLIHIQEAHRKNDADALLPYAWSRASCDGGISAVHSLQECRWRNRPSH